MFHYHLSMFYVLDTMLDIGSFQRQKKYALNQPRDFYTFPRLLEIIA